MSALDNPTKDAWLDSASGGRDFVDVMVRDADFALVMWGVTGQSVNAQRELVERPWPHSSLVLRVRSRSNDRHPRVRTFDVPLERWCGARYVPLGKPGSTHTFALGLKREEVDGHSDVFIKIVAGQNVESPRKAPLKSATDPQWGVSRPVKELKR